MISVDDDPGVSRAVQRDLRRRYGERYRVLRAESGAEGLELLAQVRLRDESVALLVADQRMPRMNGVEFLEKAREMVPDAKRVLLTAYADTQAAIDAINRVALDHYLMKPWDPPEEQLYPVLDDLLSDWQAAHRRRRRHPGGGAPVLAGVARAEGLPRAQQRALPVVRRGDGPRCPPADGGRERRPREPAAAGVPGRRGAGGALQPGGGRARGAHDPRRPAVLRPDRGGRGPGRPRGRRVRGVGGPAHGAGGARRAGRPGRAELAHRELPRLPGRPLGQRPHAPGDRAGAALRRAAAVGAGRDPPGGPRPGAGGAPGRRRGDQRARRGDRDRRAVPHA